jgi:hypothetical protein
MYLAVASGGTATVGVPVTAGASAVTVRRSRPFSVRPIDVEKDLYGQLFLCRTSLRAVRPQPLQHARQRMPHHLGARTCRGFA